MHHAWKWFLHACTLNCMLGESASICALRACKGTKFRELKTKLVT